MIGKTVSHYEVLEALGAGGMGVVYKARDPRLDRLVALKFLPSHIATQDLVKQRFVNEARAASALDHANICTIHEIDETADGQLFIVMAFYEGESLKERIRRGGIAPREAIDLASQVAEGLAVAHDRGILHRDIKPANIHVTPRGEAKILDFGLAKIGGGAQLTRTGTSMGTLQYMPPEQLTGQPVDVRADVWALGAVLYEMLTGRAAFPGETEGAVVYAIVHDAPQAPTVTCPSLPSGFDAVVAKALAKDLGQRYATVSDLRVDLETLGLELARQESHPTVEHATLPAREVAVGPSAGTGGTSTIAVIDFVNLSRDTDADWLCAGIAETISVDLKKLPSVAVIGRQRVHKALAGTEVAELSEDELAALGRRLGTRWLFWGGFQKMGESLRLTAQCLDVARVSALSTIKLDGTMADIFDLQDEIVAKLIATIELEVSDSVLRRIEGRATRDLGAYEYCAKARGLINQMGAAALEQAAPYLQKAIALDAGYATAHATLGQLLCMRYIGSTDPADLEAAVRSLERARELDDHLADAYLWLAYAYVRMDQFPDALTCGERAVELDSEDPLAYYFVAVAHWFRGTVTYDTSGYPAAVGHLARVNELAPRWQAGYQVRGTFFLLFGQYQEARECFSAAAEIEESGDFELSRFVGALAMLARTEMRLGRDEEAQRLFERSLAVVGRTEHVFGQAIQALTYCGLGDLALGRKRWDRALDAFGAALEIVRGSPEALGIGWFQLRAQIGLGKCFRGTKMLPEARSNLEATLTLLADKQGYDFSGMWDGGDGEVWFDLALLYAAGHDAAGVLRALERAMECGWQEAPRLDAEPGLRIVRDEARFRQLRGRLAGRPVLA